MGHDHGHDHTHGANKKALMISFIIITAYMVIEAAGGLITNSLALLSDAGHMLSDSISLGVGLLAFTLGEKVANYSKTYGYKRFEGQSRLSRYESGNDNTGFELGIIDERSAVDTHFHSFHRLFEGYDSIHFSEFFP